MKKVLYSEELDAIIVLDMSVITPNFTVFEIGRGEFEYLPMDDFNKLYFQEIGDL